ncbi:MAG: hypothetical protein AAFR61_25630 [Bacteroidota bacterium]
MLRTILLSLYFLIQIWAIKEGAKQEELKMGLYQTAESENFYAASIRLEENGTYQYKGSWGIFSGHSLGRWEVRNNYLHFRSDIKDFKNLDIEVTEEVKDTFPEVKVMVQNEKNQPLKCLVVFNENEKLECTWEKCFFEKGVDLKSFRVFYFQGESKTYYLKNPQSNIFHITLPHVPSSFNSYEIINDSAEIISKDSFIYRNHVFIKSY